MTSRFYIYRLSSGFCIQIPVAIATDICMATEINCLVCSSNCIQIHIQNSNSRWQPYENILLTCNYYIITTNLLNYCISSGFTYAQAIGTLTPIENLRGIAQLEFRLVSTWRQQCVCSIVTNYHCLTSASCLQTR